jgi:hypothetical protein
MTQNLDTLRDEMLSALAADGFMVFHGEMRHVEGQVLWDVRRRPDFREFLKAASAAGAKLIVFHCEEYSATQADEALEDLDATRLPEEDYRSFTRRLKELREYDGFTCVLELSFDVQDRTYLFHLHTDWFEEYLNIRGDIDDAFPDEDEESDESMGGF